MAAHARLKNALVYGVRKVPESHEMAQMLTSRESLGNAPLLYLLPFPDKRLFSVCNISRFIRLKIKLIYSDFVLNGSLKKLST